MSEFLNRVEAQRQILRIVNERPWKREQLFALNSKAIQRWTSANQIDTSEPVVHLLSVASAEIFIMANHSDDPIAGEYQMTQGRVTAIASELKATLSS